MEHAEDIKSATDIVHYILRSKKTLTIYPPNNPVYIKTLNDLHVKFKKFFDYKDTLTLKIGQYSIFYESEEIYYSPEKENNLALFFFKDGLRELTFKKGLSQEELEEFMKIVATDFEKTIDDDIVTLMWEKNFQNIQYVVEPFTMDEIDEGYVTKAVDTVKGKVSDADGLIKTYDERLEEEPMKDASIMLITDDDLQALVKDIERDSSSKMGKIVGMLFEILYQPEKDKLEDTMMLLKDAIKFSIAHGDIQTALNVIREAKEAIEDPLLTEEIKKCMKILLMYVETEEIINLLGELLDSGIRIKEETFKEFVEFLSRDAIEPLVKLLGELKTIYARKRVIEALISIGKKDMQRLLSKLNDHRWYIVRNIVYILRQIGDKSVADYLLKAIRHKDMRVRKEVIKALGELGGHEALESLKECLDDPDPQIRIASAKAIGNIGGDAAKKIILEEISKKEFKGRDFAEKEKFYEVLSRWKDSEVFDFLIQTLKKKSFLGIGMDYENMACAAFCLGLLGNKDALPLLYKHKDSSNKLLREYSCTAIKRLEYAH